METAKIAGIARHRLVDGKGITTLVLLQGCPLRCKYCLNPQALNVDKEDVRVMNCDELYEAVKVDDLYFQATGGGITFGGGEPLLQSQFIEEFRWTCGWDWRFTIETSLNVPQEDVARVLPITDEFVVDIKDMNNEIYERYTGKSNKQTIENLKWLVEQGAAKRILVRVPSIPLFNGLADIDMGMKELKAIGISRFNHLTYIK